ncbi:unnamed protein product [Vitrella brassicaformis CCMP3155]|uniref:C2 domain-containing protein n=4 Tax=Vitrella brassicaformis TaxID=1169539 RepID=A0A0G4FR88_VITBC|nr:unnamed protein product [Vitrella brassicaformis CCMP3155]|eukprot:CEM16751.1 unnamed protein product [Vitrella brassicaformis CCMP3155]
MRNYQGVLIKTGKVSCTPCVRPYAITEEQGVHYLIYPSKQVFRRREQKIPLVRFTCEEPRAATDEEVKAVKTSGALRQFRRASTLPSGRRKSLEMPPDPGFCFQINVKLRLKEHGNVITKKLAIFVVPEENNFTAMYTKIRKISQTATAAPPVMGANLALTAMYSGIDSDEEHHGADRSSFKSLGVESPRTNQLGVSMATETSAHEGGTASVERGDTGEKEAAATADQERENAEIEEAIKRSLEENQATKHQHQLDTTPTTDQAMIAVTEPPPTEGEPDNHAATTTRHRSESTDNAAEQSPEGPHARSLPPPALKPDSLPTTPQDSEREPGGREAETAEEVVVVAEEDVDRERGDEGREEAPEDSHEREREREPESVEHRAGRGEVPAFTVDTSMPVACTGNLRVKCRYCRGLRCADMAILKGKSSSDPYAVVHFPVGPGLIEKWTTSVVRKNVDPDLEEEAVYRVQWEAGDPSPPSELLVEVFDSDFGKSDDFLGQVFVPLLWTSPGLHRHYDLPLLSDTSKNRHEAKGSISLDIEWTPDAPPPLPPPTPPPAPAPAEAEATAEREEGVGASVPPAAAAAAAVKEVRTVLRGGSLSHLRGAGGPQTDAHPEPLTSVPPEANELISREAVGAGRTVTGVSRALADGGTDADSLIEEEDNEEQEEGPVPAARPEKSSWVSRVLSCVCGRRRRRRPFRSPSQMDDEDEDMPDVVPFPWNIGKEVEMWAGYGVPLDWDERQRLLREDRDDIEPFKDVAQLQATKVLHKYALAFAVLLLLCLCGRLFPFLILPLAAALLCCVMLVYHGSPSDTPAPAPIAQEHRKLTLGHDIPGSPRSRKAFAEPIFYPAEIARFPHYTQVEFLNRLLAALWPSMVVQLDSIISTSLPKWLAPKIATLGSRPPLLVSVNAYKGVPCMIDVDLRWTSGITLDLPPLGGLDNVTVEMLLRIGLSHWVEVPSWVGQVSVCLLRVPTITLHLKGLLCAVHPMLVWPVQLVLPRVLMWLLGWPARFDIPLMPSDELQHHSAKGLLQVHVRQGQQLRASDISLWGKASSDPYVLVRVSEEAKSWRTKSVSRSLNPQFNEIFHIPLTNPTARLLYFHVYDKDKVGSDDLLGFARVPVKEIVEKGTWDGRLELAPPEFCSTEESRNPNTRGEVMLEALRSFNEEDRSPTAPSPAARSDTGTDHRLRHGVKTQLKSVWAKAGKRPPSAGKLYVRLSWLPQAPSARITEAARVSIFGGVPPELDIDHEGIISPQPTDAETRKSRSFPELQTLESFLHDALGGGLLSVTLIRATNLRAADFNGFSDPYALLTILNAGCDVKVQRSKTIKRNLNPVWREEFLFDVRTVDDARLKVVVKDRDVIGKDDFLGQVEVPVRELLDGHHQGDIRLEETKGVPSTLQLEAHLTRT